MSNLNREEGSGSLSSLLHQVLAEWSKLYLHTSMPGIVESYDGSTRRARIRPALRLVMTGDEPGVDGEAIERSLAVNVPVAWPAGGGGAPAGWTMLGKLIAGDRGMLQFSERGLTEFKDTGVLATPDKARFFDESDCVFHPFDWGHPKDPTVVDADAAFAVQTYDGNTAILLKRGRIEFKVGTSTLVLTEATIRALVAGRNGDDRPQLSEGPHGETRNEAQDHRPRGRQPNGSWAPGKYEFDRFGRQ